MRSGAARKVVVLVVAAFLAAACGTRLPNSAFVSAQGGQAALSGNQVSNDTSGNDQSVAAGTDQQTGPQAATNQLGSNSSSNSPGVANNSNGTNSSTNSNPSNSSSGPNTASDIGVTPTSITIGNVTGVNGALGPDAFGPTLNGLEAWVGATNARGGINGRKIILDTCDDGQDGSQNLACVEKLVGHDHIFAFVDNNSLSTSGSANYEYKQGVPDIGLPLNNGYYKYPNMFTIYGVPYVRDGTQVGDHGLNWGTTEGYRFFKQVVGVSKAAFFFYSETASQSAAYAEETGATSEGIQTVYESGGHSGENIGAANFDADVLAMKNKGADVVFDTVDIAGNQKICASMDRYGVKVKAKVSTIEVASQDIGTSAWSSPCRDSIYITGSTVPYPDTKVPAIAQFRQDYATYARGATLHQWAVDGYAGAVMLADAVQSMGAAPTRKGVIAWLDAIKPDTYNVHGFYHDVDWTPTKHPNTKQACISAFQWQDSVGTFVTRSGPNEFSCYTVTETSSKYTDDGS